MSGEEYYSCNLWMLMPLLFWNLPLPISRHKCRQPSSGCRPKEGHHRVANRSNPPLECKHAKRAHLHWQATYIGERMLQAASGCVCALSGQGYCGVVTIPHIDGDC